MQIVFDKRINSRRTDTVDVDICAGKISRCIKKCVGRSRSRNIKFEIVGEFLEEIKKKFGRDNESKKVAELKQVEQGSRVMEKYVQEFR